MQAHQNIGTVLNVGLGNSGDVGSNVKLNPISLGGSRSPRSSIRLPNELIGMIFRECCHGKQIKLPMCFSCSTVTMPWVLGQVCSLWKIIVENDPILWSSLTLSYEGIRDMEVFTKRVKDVIFPRMKHSLISFTCSGGDSTDYYCFARPGGVIRALVLPNSARIKYLSLDTTFAALLPLFMARPGSFQSLEFLQIELPKHSHVTLYPGTITAFEKAPKLRTVTLILGYTGSFRGGNPLILPWMQLTTLSISAKMPYTAAVGFLPYCTQLVTCGLFVDGEPTPEVCNIMLPQLQEFTLGIYTASVYSSFLKTLILPALKDFALYLHTFHEISLQGSLLELITRSGALLELFEVLSPDERRVNDGIFELLEAMPGLHKLIIPPTISLPIPVIKAMIVGDLLPHLKAMHCTVESVPLALELLEGRRSDESPGSLSSYRGICCAVLGIPGMMECKCDVELKDS